MKYWNGSGYSGTLFTIEEFLAQGNSVDEAIDESQLPIQQRINGWLQSFENEECNEQEAERVINAIRLRVARAGLQLMYNDKPVGLTYGLSKENQKVVTFVLQSLNVMGADDYK